MPAPMNLVYRNFSVCFLALILSVVMLGVGNTYSDECKLKAAWFLTVAGGWGVAMNVLVILAYCGSYYYEPDAEWWNGGRLCGIPELIGNFVIFIWGSVIVFGPYKEWQYKDNTEETNYCPYTPYMFAFVVLIWNWVFIALRVVLITWEIFCME